MQQSEERCRGDSVNRPPTQAQIFGRHTVSPLFTLRAANPILGSFPSKLEKGSYDTVGHKVFCVGGCRAARVSTYRPYAEFRMTYLVLLRIFNVDSDFHEALR